MIDLSSGDGIEVSLRELAFEDNCRVPVVGGFICKASFLEKVAGMGPFWGNPREIAVEAYRRLGVDLIMQFVLPKPDEVSTKSSKPTNFTRREKRDFASPEDVVESIRQLPSGSELQSSFDHKSSTEEYSSRARGRWAACSGFPTRGPPAGSCGTASTGSGRTSLP